MFRAITCIVLLFSLVTLSGLGATASALMCPGAVEACCGGGEEPDRRAEHPQEEHAQDREQEHGLDQGDPCYAPECFCSFCIPDDLTAPPSPGLPPNLSGTAAGPPSPIHPSDFVSSIEYPPEAA